MGQLGGMSHFNNWASVVSLCTNYGEWYDHQGTSKSYFSGENGEKICECGLSNDCENSLNGDVNLFSFTFRY